MEILYRQPNGTDHLISLKMTTGQQKKILIMGIGNDILTDDGIGTKIVNDLRRRPFPTEVTFQNATVGGLEILEMIQGFAEVVFIDAIKTKAGKPGDTYYMNMSDFTETMHLSNLHDISFPEAVKLGEKLSLPLPSKLHVFAVEIRNDTDFSEKLSPELQENYPAIFRDAEQCMRDILMGVI
jgi:hydrogenase maturation protease